MSDYPGLGSDPLPGPALCPFRPIPDGIEEERVREQAVDEECDVNRSGFSEDGC